MILSTQSAARFPIVELCSSVWKRIAIRKHRRITKEIHPAVVSRTPSPFPLSSICLPSNFPYSPAAPCPSPLLLQSPPLASRPVSTLIHTPILKLSIPSCCNLSLRSLTSVASSRPRLHTPFKLHSLASILSTL